MLTIEESYKTIDSVFQFFMSVNAESSELWLLQQTYYTAQSRRNMLQKLKIADGAHVLDIGTGLGALAFELASTQPLRVTGIDEDPTMLSLAEEIHDVLKEQKCYHAESRIQFRGGDIYRIPYPDDTFDVVFVRFVYQHLKDPIAASREVFRVLKPGGFACVIDTDDQLTLTYPEVSGSFETLRAAFSQLQVDRGGDRLVGRKLASYLYDAGLIKIKTDVDFQAAFSYIKKDDISLQFTLLSMSRAKEQMIANGLITEKEFDLHYDRLQDEAEDWQFGSSAQFIVTGYKPQS